MKKIMIMAVVVATSVVASAANFKWTGGNIYDGTGSTESTAKYSGTAYLFDAGVISQKALFDAIAESIAAGETYSMSDSSVASVAVNSGAISTSNGANAFSYGTGGNTYDFYFAILDGKNLYLSNIKEDITAYTTESAANIAFGTQNSSTAGTFSSTAVKSEFTGAGYWQAVPEPTSGVLLLLGVAGLALRRKRA